MPKTASAFTLLCLSASFFVALPAYSQNSIAAPSGWKTQMRAGGAKTFTPPDLKTGEIYSVTTYAAAPGGGNLGEYLRKFAGPVGKAAGQLAAPLKIQVRERIVSGTGTYLGPGGAPLGVVFLGVSVDGGASVSVSRTLFSDTKLLERYGSARSILTNAMIESLTSGSGAGSIVPSKVLQTMRPGGALVPGVYAGNQFHNGQLKHGLRVYLYANGEYRVTDRNDKDVKRSSHPTDLTLQPGSTTGNYKYHRSSGRLNLDNEFYLDNSADGSRSQKHFCYYGRDGAGKPTIYAEQFYSYLDEPHHIRTLLTRVGDPTKRVAASIEKARADAIQAEREREWLVAPGRGIKPAQIAAVLWDQKVTYGAATSIDTRAYLLLKDGTLRRGLPAPPDEMDIATSRRREPEVWGRWRLKNGKYQVSWDGKSYDSLMGQRALPGQPGTRIDARYSSASGVSYGVGSSASFWGVSFSKSGRFETDSSSSSGSFMLDGSGNIITSQSGSDQNGAYAGVAGGTVLKKNPKGDRAGTYRINGYVLTLRYDNGQVKRLPFFFGGSDRAEVWFEGDLLSASSVR